jgi:hypothetical protein
VLTLALKIESIPEDNFNELTEYALQLGGRQGEK